MPAISNKSALPEEEETLRLPCLATWAPPAAATKLDAVDTLNRFAPSPPVPTISTTFSVCSSTRFIKSRITWAAALISSALSPFMASPTSRPPICASEASPVMIWRISACIALKERSSRRITALIASRICMSRKAPKAYEFGDQPRCKKLANNAWPWRVSIDSG